MEKRGLMLLKVIIELLVAGICIGLLIAYVFPALHTFLFGEQKKLQAQAQLGDLTLTLEQLEEDTEESYPLFVPKGWFLVGFEKGSAGGPASCWQESCLCICGKLHWWSKLNCDKKGVCEITAKDVKLEPEKIKIPMTLSLKSNSFFTIEAQEKPKLEYAEIKTKPNIEVSYRYKLKSGGRLKENVNKIILHHTATASAERTFDILKHRELSVHYMIGKDGMIYYMIDEERLAYHAEDWNSVSIGIEIVNSGCKEDKYTDAQYESIKALINDIADRWTSISVNNEQVVGHFEVTESGKWDPSPNFDWVRIDLPEHDTLAKLGRSPPPKGWLTCIV